MKGFSKNTLFTNCKKYQKYSIKRGANTIFKEHAIEHAEEDAIEQAPVFDKIVRFYFIIDLISISFFKEVVSEIPKHLDFDIDSAMDTNILDVCCGTGLLSRYLAKLSNRVVGVDISPKMIEKAKRAVKKLPIDFVVMDATSLDFPDDSFDLVTISRGLHAMPKETRDNAVKEAHRVASSHALFIEPVRRPKSRISRAIHDFAERAEGGFENYIEFVEMDFGEYLASFGFSPSLMIKESNSEVYLCKKL